MDFHEAQVGHAFSQDKVLVSRLPPNWTWPSPDSMLPGRATGIGAARTVPSARRKPNGVTCLQSRSCGEGCAVRAIHLYAYLVQSVFLVGTQWILHWTHRQ